MRGKLAEYARSRGILLGLTTAEPLNAPQEITSVPYAADYEKRTNPGKALAGARSVFVIGVRARGASVPLKVSRGSPAGYIAACLSGEGYHNAVERELSALREFLTVAFPPFDFKTQVDNGPLAERLFAKRAGIAFQCRSRCVCSNDFGTYFNIGLLVTSIAAAPDAPDTRFCANCLACVKACPAGALDGGFDYGKCVSGVSQKRGELTERERASLGANLWGCDICQRVCPLNEGKIAEGEHAALDEIDRLTEDDFRARFPALAWRGLDALKRNAGAVRANLSGANGP
jgi:epoxyqueuosine reductase